LTGDFSGIESRVLAWLAGEATKLAMWSRFDATGDAADDPYFILGRQLGFAPDIARALGKIADLAFGYGGGVAAFKNFAPKDHGYSDDAIDGFKHAWRREHPRTTQFWYGLGRAAVSAVQSGRQIAYGRLTLRCEHIKNVPFLFLTRPSGRAISYPFARLIRTDRGDIAVSFMDNNPLTGWAEYRPGRGAWGGTYAENATQGVSRDLLAEAMVRLEAAGYPVVLHVHDEISAELPEGTGGLDEFQALVLEAPPWAS
jgi:DNA polymerase